MKPQDLLDCYDLIIKDMCEYHEMFYKLGAIGRPGVSDKIKTACVTFDREGKFLRFLFNTDFLEKLTWDQVKFVCCHEMLHLLFNHGERIKDNRLNRKIANIALDIVVNHSLIDNFGFSREDMSELGDMSPVFKDIAFKDDHQKINDDDIFEYYFKELLDRAEKQTVIDLTATPNGGSLDDHSSLPSLTEEELKEVISEAINDKEQAEKIVQELSAGTENIKDILNIIYKKQPQNKRWESVVGQIRRNLIAKDKSRTYQWHKPDRRASLIDKKFLLPTINRCDHKGKNKWDLWLFADVSGSCVNYCQRFIDAARSIPTDTFNIKFHTFNTEVESVDLKTGKFYGGGGTAFDIIEEYIQVHTKQKEYPNLVFVITDGIGNAVSPQQPKNWFWFLSGRASEDYIPDESKVFSLSDFDGYEDV